MTPGIRTVAFIQNDVLFTNNNTLTSIPDISFFVPQGKRCAFKLWIPINTGATGGIQIAMLGSSNPGLYVQQIKIFNVNAGTITQGSQLNLLAFGNALASAGFHYIEMISTVTGGVGGSQLTLQMCQNTADPNTLTVVSGGFCEFQQF